MAEIIIRPGHPGIIDLPWEQKITDWDLGNLVNLPKGISRHEVRFLSFPQGVYAVKELPTYAARNDYYILKNLENTDVSAVRPIGLVEQRTQDPYLEQSAALITAYEPYSFSYRELLSGPGFGQRRNQLLNAFAYLLVELHLAQCFWGDCSLSNVLYRYDAEEIISIMVDAETAELIELPLTDGQRHHDLDIMVENVAGGMADIAAQAGLPIDQADLQLGYDIAQRYHLLWNQLNTQIVIGKDERYKTRQQIQKLNQLGFHVSEIDFNPIPNRPSQLRVTLKIGGRTFHTDHLRHLTGIEAQESQARQILTDLYYFQAKQDQDKQKSLSAIQWRLQNYEPWIQKVQEEDQIADPTQAFCDLLYHRYIMSEGLGYDVGTQAAFDDWIKRGKPGYKLEQENT